MLFERRAVEPKPEEKAEQKEDGEAKPRPRFINSKGTGNMNRDEAPKQPLIEETVVQEEKKKVRKEEKPVAAPDRDIGRGLRAKGPRTGGDGRVDAPKPAAVSEEKPDEEEKKK